MTPEEDYNNQLVDAFPLAFSLISTDNGADFSYLIEQLYAEELDLMVIYVLRNIARWMLEELSEHAGAEYEEVVKNMSLEIQKNLLEGA